ncbi:hypothetical protein HanHA300_Chr02g0060481 [Helianthus annuus]|nr:hypothetical protein HanHA300_Chr02g0060481 [Helianthus annuus]KAJ0619182.1 hypothetical protein HanHA89_Chr02g0068501 [Helianthus annuus]KAJ0777632.1 hypothetical protein HanLR1_Chr02g0062731 [Helianthus annuus]
MSQGYPGHGRINPQCFSQAIRIKTGYSDFPTHWSSNPIPDHAVFILPYPKPVIGKIS